MAQEMVEAAVIALGLHESRQWLWNSLSGRQQDRIVDWLSGFVGAVTYDDNWRLFQVVSEQFLASVGASYSKADIERGLNRIEDWYVGDGWYSDGDGQSFDYYNGWAMHIFPTMWTRIAAATPGTRYEDRLQVYRQRLRSFLEDAIHLISPEGAPVHQGRSLTYRMATAAPYWMGTLLDASPLGPGTTRRLCSSITKYFVRHGAPDQQGLLRMGWQHPFLPMIQSYSGPGSPYWASMGFLGLLLPENHAAWTETEGSLPLDEVDQIRALAGPGWLLHATSNDQVVRLLNHGADGAGDPEPGALEPSADPHYERLAYSSHTGPVLSAHRVDNAVALFDSAGRCSGRSRIHRIGFGERDAGSWYQAWLGSEGPWRIEVRSVVCRALEVRCALVEGPSGARVTSGGYAVSGESAPTSSMSIGSTTPFAVVELDNLYSMVVGIYGFESADVRRDRDANAFGPCSASPFVFATHPGGELVLVTAILLERGSPPADSDALGLGVQVDGRVVELQLPDGSRSCIRLGE
ncbi:DUF2264 domain-containing protein [Kribbella ginsengisoli]|uniref:DUF2264 domain-containing protein n=2 Tax=Kribbella ginsengisoli TaxID=363865 RepID=A0ABP6Z6H1_9ACTN